MWFFKNKNPFLFEEREHIEAKNYANIHWISEEIVFKEILIVKILKYLNSLWSSEILCLKGWTALALFYNSWRFSEDIDFDLISQCKNDSNCFYRVKSLFKKLENDFNENFKFEIGDEKIKWKFHTNQKNFFENDIYISFDVRIKKYCEEILLPLNTKNLHKENFHFNCISPSKIMTDKFLYIGWRNKGRDLYDFLFLMRQWYKIDFDYLKEQFEIWEKRELENFFYWVSKEDLKEKILKRIEEMENYQEEIFSDINEFLEDWNKIENKNDFLLNFYSEIEKNFETTKEISDFENIEDFNLDFLEEENKKKTKEEIVEFLKNFSKTELKSWIKNVWNNSFIVIENNKYRIYKDGNLLKQFELKEDLKNFIYENQEEFFIEKF